jgi:hypothetical protein
MPRKNNRDVQFEVTARLNHEAVVDGLRDGRKQPRAATFASPKGKGSYKRKGKYGNDW